MNRATLPVLQHFHRTTALPCPYLPGRVERKVVTDLSGADAAALYHDLSRAGFRRSHSLAYRPACQGCTACVPVRIPVARYQSPRWARRILAANADLTWIPIEPRATAEQFRLFSRYQAVRHGDGDMAAMGPGDYAAMIENTPVETRLLAARNPARQLVGISLVDLMDDGLSAVYSFYEPGEPRRSLGTWLVLQLIEWAERERLPYVYLGYWISGSRKMEYKVRFKPLEAFGPEGWAPLSLES